MTDKAISPLRRRMIDDMAIRKFGPKTQSSYIRAVKNFGAFLGHSPHRATADDIRRYQLHLASSGLGVPSVNAAMTALRFFFKVTLRRSDVTEDVVFIREPQRLPVGPLVLHTAFYQAEYLTVAIPRCPTQTTA